MVSRRTEAISYPYRQSRYSRNIPNNTEIKPKCAAVINQLTEVISIANCISKDICHVCTTPIELHCSVDIQTLLEGFLHG